MISQVGQSKIIRQSPTDKVLLIGAGVTLHVALRAADKLKEEGIPSLELPLVI